MTFQIVQKIGFIETSTVFVHEDVMYLFIKCIETDSEHSTKPATDIDDMTQLIRRHLSEWLPSHYQPCHVTVVPAIPMTKHG